MALGGRVDADGGVSHNGLRTGCGDYQIVVGRIALTVRDIVLQVVEMTFGVAVDDLVIRDCCEGNRIPVDHPHSPVDHSLLVEMAECGDYGIRESRLHSEAGAVPVAGCAELAELLENDASVLLLPFPGILEEFLTAEVFLLDAHLGEPGDNLVFGCDAGVVGSRHPAGILAVHPGLADEHVIEGVVEHVAHMKDTRHVWRRDHNGIWFS